MSVEFIVCEELNRLHAEWQAAAMAFAVATRELAKLTDAYSSQAEYTAALQSVQDKRSACEEARLSTAKHREQHGC